MNSVVKRLLLLPVLTPLLLVAALALLNPRPAVALRLLTWTSPALPIGSWLAMAVGGGGLLSAAATTAALQGGSPVRRQVRMGTVPPGPRQAGRRPSPPPEPPIAAAGPQRPPGAPPPTVEVPFRVIRKGTAAAAGSIPRKPEAPSAQAGTGPAPQPAVANAVGDGWSESASDDW